MMHQSKHYTLDGDEIAAVIVLKDGKSTLVSKAVGEAQQERVAITLIRAANRMVSPDVVERIAAEVAAEINSQL